MFWNKTLLKWEEPRFAEKFVIKQLRLIDYLKSLGKFSLKLFFASYIFIWFIGWLAGKRPSNPLLSLDLMLLALMIVGCYLFIWLVTFAASKLSKPQVSLREKGLLYITFEGGINIPYKMMESFSIIKTKLDENDFYVLNIKDWKGNESFIEIDPKINKEMVAEILKSKNIQMKNPLLNLF